MNATDASRPVRVALYGAGNAQRVRLERRLGEHGCLVVASDRLAGPAAATTVADVLLVDLEAATDADLDGLDALVDGRAAPMVFLESTGLDEPAFAKLVSKLRTAAAEAGPAAQRQPSAPVEKTVGDFPVWVLAASFGGPQMLSRFFGAMERAPEAAFVIVQHIGKGFAEVLAQQLNRLAPCPVVCAAPGTRLRPGHGFVAPIGQWLRIDAGGRFYFTAEAPDVLYSPSIDAVMEQVADRFGSRGGAIVFSGMGDDGTRGVRAIARAGGAVWAQDAASCAIDYMPNCARATGAVTHEAPPEQLARDLARIFQQSAPRYELSV